MGFRRKARECAVQMLFQTEFRTADVQDLNHDFFSQVPRVPQSAKDYATRLVEGTAAQLSEIDSVIAANARNWRIERMPHVDRNILRMAVYELLYERDTPRKVIINEACDIAHKYGSDESVAFVNGVLDGVMRELETLKPSA